MLRRRRTGPAAAATTPTKGGGSGKAQPRAVVYETGYDARYDFGDEGGGGDYELRDEVYEAHIRRSNERERTKSYDEALADIFPPLDRGQTAPQLTSTVPAQESLAPSPILARSATDSHLPELPPLPTKLGLYSSFVRDGPETIVMREQWSWVGDDFEIATADGREVLNMRAKFWSASLRKEFLAPSGDPLFTLRLRLTRLLRSYYLELPNGQMVLDMPQHWGWAHNRFSVTFCNAFDGKDATLKVEGDLWGRKASITWNDCTVARIRRQYRNWRGLSGRHTFLLDVAPGADVALMVALVVGFDEGTRLLGPGGGGGA